MTQFQTQQGSFKESEVENKIWQCKLTEVGADDSAADPINIF